MKANFIHFCCLESEFIVQNKFHNWTSELGCIWHIFRKLGYFWLFSSTSALAKTTCCLYWSTQKEPKILHFKISFNRTLCFTASDQKKVFISGQNLTKSASVWAEQLREEACASSSRSNSIRFFNPNEFFAAYRRIAIYLIYPSHIKLSNSSINHISASHFENFFGIFCNNRQYDSGYEKISFDFCSAFTSFC